MRWRSPLRNLRSAIVVTVVLSTALASVATAAALVTRSRSVIYQTRQDTILEDFFSRSATLFDHLPSHSPPTAWEYGTAGLPDASRVIDLDTGRSAGELPAGAIPATITRSWRSRSEELHYLRTDWKGTEVFFVGVLRRQPRRLGGGTVGVVSAYPLTGEHHQVDELLKAGLLIGAAALLLAAVGSFVVGTALTRPLRGVRAMAAALGAREPMAPVHSRFTDVEEVAEALRASSEHLEETIDELARREGHARRLVSDVAHELRTPLTSMLAVSEILEDLESSSPEQRRTAVSVTRRSTDRLAALSRSCSRWLDSTPASPGSRSPRSRLPLPSRPRCASSTARVP